jgi:hypothetical protein
MQEPKYICSGDIYLFVILSESGFPRRNGPPIRSEVRAPLRFSTLTFSSGIPNLILVNTSSAQERGKVY